MAGRVPRWGISGPRLQRILALAAPIVGGMVSQNLLNLVDTAMVGAVGKDALAGVGLASFAVFTSFAALMGLSSGVQAIAARRVGEERPEVAAQPLHLGALVALATGIPLAVLLWGWADDIFPYLNGDPAVVEHAVPYFQARLTCIMAIGVNVSFRGFWNGVDRPTLYFRTLVTMHVINVIVSYVLIFGLFGAPELGSLGAGVGSAVATWCGTLQYLVLGWTEGRRFGFLRAEAWPTAASLRALGSLAWPSSVQQVLFAAGFTVYFWIVGLIGTAELAAGNVLINLMLVAVLPGIGLGLAAMSLVGQALGRKDPEDAVNWGWDVVKVATVAMALIGLPMLLVPDPILWIFLADAPEVVEVARLPLRLVGGSIALEAVGLVLMHGLLGAGAARTVAVVAVGLQWVFFLPGAYVVGPWLGYGLTAVVVLQVVQRGLQAAVFAWLWQRGDWKLIEV